MLRKFIAAGNLSQQHALALEACIRPLAGVSRLPELSIMRWTWYLICVFGLNDKRRRHHGKVNVSLVWSRNDAIVVAVLRDRREAADGFTDAQRTTERLERLGKVLAEQGLRCKASHKDRVLPPLDGPGGVALSRGTDRRE